MKLGLPTILHLVVGGLGLINFFVGFADVYDGGDSFFANGSVAARAVPARRAVLAAGDPAG